MATRTPAPMSRATSELAWRLDAAPVATPDVADAVAELVGVADAMVTLAKAVVAGIMVLICGQKDSRYLEIR